MGPGSKVQRRDQDNNPDRESTPLPDQGLASMNGPPALLPTDVKSAIAIARDQGLFATLSETELLALQQGAKFIEIPENSELRTRQEKIYVLTSGKVICYLVDAGGIQYKLSTGQAGDVFGELAFSQDRAKRSPSTSRKIYIEAIEPVTMIGILPDVWDRVVGQNIASERFLRFLTRDRLLFMNEFAARAVQLDPDLEDLKPRTLADRAADWITNRIGSWKFVIGAGAFMAGYTALNLVAVVQAWDPYPFVFLNLILSTASAFATPILLISQNRQSNIDRISARAQQRVTLGIERQLRELSERSSGHRLDAETFRRIVREELAVAQDSSKKADQPRQPE